MKTAGDMFLITQHIIILTFHRLMLEITTRIMLPPLKEKKNCVRIFVVILKTENDANRVASTLRGGGRKEHFILSQNNLSWVGVAKEGDIMLQLNDAVFNRRKGVVGPIKTEIGFLVAHILDFYPEGSVAGVDEVYDKIFSMLYLEKRREKYKTIIEED